VLGSKIHLLALVGKTIGSGKRTILIEKNPQGKVVGLAARIRLLVVRLKNGQVNHHQLGTPPANVPLTYSLSQNRTESKESTGVVVGICQRKWITKNG